MKVLRTVDERVAHAVIRLRANDDYQILMAYLAQQQRRLDVECRSLDGPDLYRKQGAATLIDDLERLTAEAPDIVSRFREPRNSVSR